MRADEKRHYYQPKRIPPRFPLLECILAVLGALGMAAIFVAAVAAVR